MIRALSLVWDPATVWVRVARDRKSLGFVIASYFLPVLFLAALADGFTLAHWGTWTVGSLGLIHFNLSQVLVFETVRSALTCVMVIASSHILWLLREPFYARYDFPQALVLVMYSLGPLFLCQALNGISQINLWASWSVGIYLSLRIFYHGVRSMAKTDPRSAVGLYLVGSAVIVGLMGAQRFMLVQCLTGHGSSANNWIYALALKL